MGTATEGSVISVKSQSNLDGVTKLCVDFLKELRRIDQLILELQPALLGNVVLPSFDLHFGLFTVSEIPRYTQKMKGLYSLLLDKTRQKPKQKLGAPKDPDHDKIVSIGKAKHPEGIKWDAIADELNKLLGRRDLTGRKVRDRCRKKSGGKNSSSHSSHLE